jgi:putative mRNA 3-end processing factor
LLTWSAAGLFSPPGQFHIDPSRAVENALVTHAHSDHARRGSRQYFCAAPGEGLLRERIGHFSKIRALAYGEKFRLGETELSFHPAGHILGSAQVRIQRGTDVWVASGDYKRDEDPTCEPFEVVPCDTFVTEATFGQPLYRWPLVPEVAAEIESWWRGNAAKGLNSVLYCYSLGKAQRLLAELAPRMREGETVLVHDTVEALNRHYREKGVVLAATQVVSSRQKGAPIRGALILAPPGIQGTALMGRLGEFETAFASGWMRLRRSRFSRRYDRSFVLSDHADWPSLVRTVRETGARKVYVMHGSNETLARYLRESAGLDARPIEALERA